jgi:hypothetical protein
MGFWAKYWVIHNVWNYCSHQVTKTRSSLWYKAKNFFLGEIKSKMDLYSTSGTSLIAQAIHRYQIDAGKGNL